MIKKEVSSSVVEEDEDGKRGREMICPEEVSRRRWSWSEGHQRGRCLGDGAGGDIVRGCWCDYISGSSV